jgi:DNA-binding transcriptional ArsR family regulator
MLLPGFGLCARARLYKTLQTPSTANPSINHMVDKSPAHAIINHMVDNQAAALDRVFRALASEPRRKILRRAAQGPCTVTELAERFGMSLAAASKHVRVLDEATLLRETQQGRLRWRSFNPDALEPARASIEELRAFWEKQLDNLERFLGRAAAGPRKKRGRR